MELLKTLDNKEKIRKLGLNQKIRPKVLIVPVELDRVGTARRYTYLGRLARDFRSIQRVHSFGF